MASLRANQRLEADIRERIKERNQMFPDPTEVTKKREAPNGGTLTSSNARDYAGRSESRDDGDEMKMEDPEQHLPDDEWNTISKATIIGYRNKENNRDQQTGVPHGWRYLEEYAPYQHGAYSKARLQSMVDQRTEQWDKGYTMRREDGGSGDEHQ